MARYALLNAQGEVVNVCEWDGEAPFDPSPLTMRPATALDEPPHKTDERE